MERYFLLLFSCKEGLYALKTGKLEKKMGVFVL